MRRVLALNLHCCPSLLSLVIRIESNDVFFKKQRQEQISIFLDSSIWNAGETMNGPTIRTLQKAARANKIWCGASFLEVEGSDFFNSFVLVDPLGNVAGK